MEDYLERGMRGDLGVMEICYSLFSAVGAQMSTVHRKATLKICVFYFLLTTLQFF